MTKRDFELIAKTLREVAAIKGLSKRNHNKISRVFAVALSTTNERFDATRFYNACTNEELIAEEQEERVAYGI